ncbi:shikimate dehydrogenase [candidate division WOR-3 bacterium]|nr:shikimate dehydrogenase [candidate division WOR-3 bacterium]
MLVTGIIGYPLKITLSPPMHNAAFKALGIDGMYVALPVKEEKLKEAVFGLSALNFRGFNITIPYKKKVMEYLDEISIDATAIDAVNTVLIDENKLKGFNTDTYGFEESLNKYEIDLEGKKVMLIGAGGVAYACSYIINQKNPSRFIITDIVEEKAKKLSVIYQADRIFSDDVEKMASESDVILNATPVDLQDKILTLMKENSVYYDINYKFQVKKQKGVKVVNGSLMLILQGARAFTIWTGQDAPIDVMKKAIGFEI